MKKLLYFFGILLCLGSVSAAQARSVDFSGFSWQIRTEAGFPGPNTWGDNAKEVFVDSTGRLHLLVSIQNGQWHSTEVYLDKSLGYGQYIFDIDSAVDKLDTNLVASPFLYQDDSHEIDIEYSYWQIPKSPNLHFSAQPYLVKGNIKSFNVNLDPGTTRNIIDWQPNKILFSTVQNNEIIANYEYTGSNNFNPGKEQLHFNFWQINGSAPLNKTTNEFIIKNFSFIPYGSDLAVAPPTPLISSTPVVIDQTPAAVQQKPVVENSAPAPVEKKRHHRHNKKSHRR
ncbi:MAG: hypothetical protein NT034_04105 [Candidatus Magasanikbacteria bacterium]|nr:hypothetical protein [Candidatus Magasanikbacteria bacterium]